MITGSGQVAFFDSDYAFISGAGYGISDGTKVTGNVYDFTLEAPSTAAYFAISCIDAAVSSAYVRIYGTISDWMELLKSEGTPSKLAGKDILVFGDSITDNTYHTIGEPAWNKWATYLSINDGFNLTNNSYHATGFVADTSTQDKSRTLPKRIVQYTASDHFDMIVIFMGINDFIQGEPWGTDSDTDKDTYILPAMKYCLDYLVDTFPGAKLVAILPLQYTGKNLIKNGLNLKGYVDKFKEVYDDYSIPTLNLYEEGGFRTWNETFRDLYSMVASDGQGGTFHDGLHPNTEWDHGYLSPKIEVFLENNI